MALKSLKISDFKINYGKQLVLEGESIHFSTGEIHIITGENGSGKTTLFKLLLGLEQLSTGEITYEDCRGHLIANRNIVKSAHMDSESFEMHMSGYNNLIIEMYLRKKCLKDVEYVIELLDIKSFIHKKVSTYSLGMKQRLGFARLFISEPQLLILDEPTNGLDKEHSKELMIILDSYIKEKNSIIIVSTHNESYFKDKITKKYVIDNFKIKRI